MRHITLTGYHAGVTICGAAKDIEGDTYAHAGEWLDNPECLAELCPVCARVWGDVGECLQDED